MRSLFLIGVMLMSFTAQALDKDIEIDILTKRVTSLLKAGKNAEALPVFEQLEGVGAKLPESFDYYYIETLDKAGSVIKAVERSESYVQKYGRKGKYYDSVIEVLARRGPEAEAARRLANAEVEKKRRGESLVAALADDMISIPYARPFLMGKTEVTQLLWRAVMGGDPPELRSKHKGCDDCAVTDVSWNDAKEFIARLNARTQGGYRLPSEAEWQFACHAGVKQTYCGSDNVGEVAWIAENSGDRVHPVGQKKANAWGLYDMSGNVWEWTEDCYNGNCGRRVVRGGSWFNSSVGARASIRSLDDVGNPDNYSGFRLTSGHVQRGRLGVTIQDVNQSLADSFGLKKPTGALVSSVDSDSPAAKAGIEAGDVILSANGREIANTSDLPALIASMSAGETVKLHVWRKGAAHNIDVKVGSFSDTKIASNDSSNKTKGRLGVAVRPLSPEEQRQAEVKGGLLVQDVDGAAARAGIQPGDIIVSVNGEAVSGAEQLRNIINKAGKKVAILVERGNSRIFVPIDLD